MFHDGTPALMPQSRHAEAPESGSFLRQAHDFLWRRRLVVAVATVLVPVLAMILVQELTPRFIARADMLLDPRRNKVFGQDDAAPLVGLDTANVESAIALIKGNVLLGNVVRAEHLASDPAFNGIGETPGRLGQWVRRLLGRSTPPQISPERHALGTLFKALRVERIGKAYVLSISVTATDPNTAARLANAVAEGFVHDQRDARLEAARREAMFFTDRLKPLSEQLRRSEDALEGFRRVHDLLPRAASAQGTGAQPTINEQQLADLNGKLANARVDAALAWARYDGARGASAKGGAIEAIPDVVASHLIAQLRQQQAEVARKEGDLAARYSESYPVLVNARAERREIERSIAREMARIVANLKNAYDIAKSQEDGLRASVTLMTGAAGLDSDVGRELRERERLKLVDQTVFETYLARAKGAEQQSTFEEHDVRIISPADVPVVPAFPQAGLVLAFSTLFGLGLGVALGLVLDVFDPGFTTPQAIENALGVPVLASIPWLKPRDRTVEGKAVEPPRLISHRPHGRYAEAVHAIRAGMRRSDGRPSGIVLVTSSVSGEGKSMLSLSLAVSAARAGQRVLILDADLRHPTLSRTFGAEHRLGLVDMLSGLVGTDQTTRPLAPDLWLMPGGRKSAIAPDLFASARMAAYLAHLRRIYDLVVIDAPPVDPVIDAHVLSALSDSIVFVVGWRDTAKEVVARSLQRLGHSHKVAGLVLNKVDESKTPQRGRPGQRKALLQRYVEA